MAEPGWYPDPNGVSQRLRYWDGSSWSGRTTTDPDRRLPRQSTMTKRRSRVPLLWVAGLLVLVLIGLLSLMVHEEPEEVPDIWSTSLTDSPLGRFSSLF